MKQLDLDGTKATKFKGPAARRRSTSPTWLVTFRGGLLAILLSGCVAGEVEPKTIDTTEGQLKLDNEAALVKRDGINLKRITRLSDGTVVYDASEEPYPHAMDLTFRLWPDRYDIFAEKCLIRQRLMGPVNLGCAYIYKDFQLEAGHIYFARGSQHKKGWWMWHEIILTAWFEDKTTDEILYESEINVGRSY